MSIKLLILSTLPFLAHAQENSSLKFTFSSNKDTSHLYQAIQESDLKLAKEVFHQITLSIEDKQRLIDYAQIVIDLRKDEVEAVKEGKQAHTPAQLRLWFDKVLFAGSLSLGIIMPIWMWDNLTNAQGSFITPSDKNTFMLLLGISALALSYAYYKPLAIKQKIKNAIFQQYEDAVAIKQLLYQNQVASKDQLVQAQVIPEEFI